MNIRQNNTLTKLAKKYVLLSCLVFVLALATAPVVAGAAFGDAKSYILLAPIPGTYNTANCAPGTVNTYNNNGATTGNGASTLNCTTDFITYIKGFFGLVISLSSIIAVLVITFEGFKLAVSTSEGAREVAKDRVQQALTGLGLVLGSYLILNTVNPKLTKIDFMVSKISDAGLGSSAYLQNGLGTALDQERAAEAQRIADREANAAFNDATVTIKDELAALGDCSAPNQDPVACEARVAQLSQDLRAAQDKTDLQAGINALNRQITNNVYPLLVPPVTPAQADQARAELAQMWRIASPKIMSLRTAGRNAEADALLAEAQRLQQTVSAKITQQSNVIVPDVVTP